MARFCHILAVLAWLLTTVATAYAAPADVAPPVDRFTIDASANEACHKLTASPPIPKQCNGAGGHSGSVARSGSNRPDDVPLSATRHAVQTQRQPGLLRRVDVPLVTYAKRRRAPFWRVFAFSARLRN